MDKQKLNQFIVAMTIVLLTTQPQNTEAHNEAKISGHRLGAVANSDINIDPDEPVTISEPVAIKESHPLFNPSDVKLVIKEIEKSGQKIDIGSLENTSLFNKISEKEFYQDVKDKFADTKKDLAKKDLYIKHKGLFWSPDEKKPNNFEIGYKPTKKTALAEYESQTKKDQDLKIGLEYGKGETSLNLQFNKKF